MSVKAGIVVGGDVGLIDKSCNAGATKEVFVQITTVSTNYVDAAGVEDYEARLQVSVTV